MPENHGILNFWHIDAPSYLARYRYTFSTYMYCIFWKYYSVVYIPYIISIFLDSQCSHKVHESILNKSVWKVSIF